MKGKTYILMTAAAALIVAGNLTPDTSYAMASEDDMTGDINVGVPVDKTSYKYDTSIDTPEEFMAESHIFEDVENIEYFAGDPTSPSPEALMAEELTFDDTEPSVSKMLNKYGTPAAGEKKE